MISQAKSSERREYYRINDVVGFTYSRADADRPGPSVASDIVGLPLKNLMVEVDQELNKAINAIWQDDPTLAYTLGLLNRKMSMIAAHCMSEDKKEITSYEQVMVNVSGCGIAFDSTEALPAGTRLELSLLLKPSNTSVTLSGSVIRCEARRPGAQKPFNVRVQFDDSNLADQERLIQHIVQKQCAQIGYRFPEAVDGNAE